MRLREKGCTLDYLQQKNFNSTIVRLRARNWHDDSKLLQFQFNHCAIKSQNRVHFYECGLLFQFNHCAIKSSRSPISRELKTYFNSTIVRLRDTGNNAL